MTNDVAGVVRRVRVAFEDGRTRDLDWRRDQIAGLARMLDQDHTAFTDALAADLGKPRLEGWATDVGTTAGEARYARKNLYRWAKPRRANLPLSGRPGKAEIVPEPLGLSLILAPWNYPANLVLDPMIASIAAGNAVVAKPSELAPRTSATIAELVPNYVDPEVFAIVEGDASVASELLDQPFDHIFFTGSTRVGRMVMEKAARNVTPVVLELGGKSPVIVDESANLEVTARRIAWGKWLNAGQTCIAPDYVLAVGGMRDELVDGIRRAWESFADGSIRMSPHYARVVDEHACDRLEGLLTNHGGLLVAGGEVDRAACFVEPTIIVDPDPSAPLMTDEIFGPILPIIPTESIDAAVDFVNSRAKPLALYVFASDNDVVDDVIERTSSGGVVVNHVLLHFTPPDLPFGGVGASGTGRYHGQAGFDTFSNLRSVLHKQTKPDPKLIYPPYTRFKERIIRRFL